MESQNNDNSAFDSVDRNKAFLQNLLQDITEKYIWEQKSEVVDFKYYDELKELIPVDIPKNGRNDDELLKLSRDIFRYSITSRSDRFYNQLFGKAEPAALGGALLTECINISAYTYEVAPVVLLLEKETFNYIGRLFNFPQIEGLFCPGGSFSLMNALSLAKTKAFPQSRETGIFSLPQMRIYTSENSHYSITKAAIFMGFGTSSITTIECDEFGRMIPLKLDEAIQNDLKKDVVPLFVNATCGTTVFGAFDPVEEIADICSKHSVWLHADGCLGASVILSKKHKHLLTGIERADSLAWNPHKMLGIPLQCSMLLTVHVGLLNKSHATRAACLFQKDKFYDTSLDTGDSSLQCGRKVDIIKMWLSWQALGETGLEKYVDKKISLAKYLANAIKLHPNFILIIEPSIINVCFYYIPRSLRDCVKDKEFWQKMHKVAPIIKERMTKAGSMMIGYNKQGDMSNFWRMVTTQVDNSFADMDFILEEFERLGHDIVI